MFVLTTIQVSYVWTHLGIKSIILAYQLVLFPPEHSSPVPREMETERQTTFGSPGRDDVCIFCVLVPFPSETPRNNLGGLEWRLTSL